MPGGDWLKQSVAKTCLSPHLNTRIEYEDTPGFCKAATLQDIQANDYVLTPGRYVGAPPIEDDGIPFEEKMADLTRTLYRQMAESEKLDSVIRENLKGLGFDG